MLKVTEGGRDRARIGITHRLTLVSTLFPLSEFWPRVKVRVPPGSMAENGTLAEDKIPRYDWLLAEDHRLPEVSANTCGLIQPLVTTFLLAGI